MEWFFRSVLLVTTIALAGCQLEEDLKERFQFNEDDYEDVSTATLKCVEIELRLTRDLAYSSNTPANAYEDINFTEWCQENLIRDDLEDYVGNANAWEATETDPLITATSPRGRATRPYPAHGASLDLHVLRAEGTLPFVRKIHFADWQGPNGRCALEMRVYQGDIGVSGKRPLLYLHGGGWRNRTTAMTAAEVLTPHMLEEHVVFMPAYPLNHDQDGPVECQRATFGEILASVQNAFEWVEENMTTFGVADGSAIDLVGHSAGGQLAMWLGIQNRARAGKVLNFYGPVEFANFLDEVDSGGLYEQGYEYAKRTLRYLLQVDDLAALERPYDELVMQNSVSEIVAAEGVGALPPFMIVQGNADTTVPVEQALRPCEAIGGSPDAAGGDFTCGNGSRVIIVDDADHNFDRRCVSGVFPEQLEDEMDNPLERFCPAANADPEKVSGAVSAAYQWLRSG